MNVKKLLCSIVFCFLLANLFSAVTITAPSLNISACALPSGYSALGNIVFNEAANGDFLTGSAINTNYTFTLTAPTNFEFQAATGAVAAAGGADISAISIVVTTSTIVVTYQSNQATRNNGDDLVTISGIQVRANNAFSSGYIFCTANTLAISGVTINSTVIGTLAAYSSCNSPGGVSGSLRTWFKASNVAINSARVASWTDNSGNNFHHTQATAGNRPTVSTGIYNNNDAIVFDGNNNNLSYSTGVCVPAASTGLTIFGVANLTGTTGDTWGTVYAGQTDATWNGGGYGLAALSSANTSFGFFIRDWDGPLPGEPGTFVTATTAACPIANGTIMTGVWNGGAAPNAANYRWNSVSQGTSAYTPGTVGNNGTISTIGGAPTTQYNFYGRIAEIIVYSTGLTTAEINKVESYLALKYGITLGNNGSGTAAYTNAAGTTIWSSGTGYHYDVTGIGAESSQGLQQNKSASLNVPTAAGATDMPFTIAQDLITAPTNVDDATYVMVGHNNSSLSGSVVSYTHAGTSVAVAQNRLFRIQTTNLTGGKGMLTNMTNLEVQFDMSRVPGNGGGFGLGAPNAAANLRLMLDDNTTNGEGSANERIYSNSGVAGNVIKFLIPVGDLPMNGTYFFRIGSTSFTLAPLPVELLTFDAIYNSGHVDVTWQTASETNNDYFTIERSRNGSDFEALSQVDGAGTSTSIIDYAETDFYPFEGISYYRLKQTDFDGNIHYSTIVPVNYIFGNDGFSIYPNPVSSGSAVYMELAFPQGKDVLVVVRDMQGKEFFSKVLISADNGQLTAVDPEHNIAPGTYIIVASSENKVYSKLLVVK